MDDGPTPAAGSWQRARMPAHAVDLDLRRPFLRADALAAGVSPSSLRGRRFRRIFTGVYVHASVPAHPLLRVQAALVLHPPTAFASHGPRPASVGAGADVRRAR